MIRNLTCTMLWLFVAAIAVAETETVTIPLDQIWAYRMQGTRDVRELEPRHFGERTREQPESVRHQLLVDSMTEQIRKTIKYAEPPSANAKPGFAVLGRGLEALREAYLVLVEKHEPQELFPEDSEVSLVFFTHFTGSYVQLSDVKIKDNDITIHFRFIPHETKNITCHFAIIPLGKLSVGKYHVDLVQLPIGEQHTESGRLAPIERVRQIICQPFSFSIEPR